MVSIGRAAAGLALAFCFTAGAWASAQGVASVVLDPNGSPMPGVTVELLDNGAVVRTAVTDAKGAFAFDAALAGDTVVFSVAGFETQSQPRGGARTIVMQLARATGTAVVTASSLAEASPSEATLGHAIAADALVRMPSAHLHAQESLPLLPSVIRGPDGLMQLGGARAQETPLLIDGFNVTDPATGRASINLPFEAVKGINFIRDPMAVTYGGLVGGLVEIDSNPGADAFAAGVQGFIPRPRFASPGFGRLEGIFPRVHASGSAAGGRIHYLSAAEYDYERIPVPNVTLGRGPDIVEQSTVWFTRVDAGFTKRQQVSFETFVFPSSTGSSGLSPRRDAAATSDVSSTDVFAGVTDRFIANDSNVLTVQVGALVRRADVTPNGSGPAYLSPAGWTGNAFANVTQSASRYSVSGAWARAITTRGQTHDLTISADLAVRSMTGRVTDGPVVVSDADGLVVRRVDFGPASAFGAHDRPFGLAVRDLWQPSHRLQFDGGVRLDHSPYGGWTPSARIGVRYAFDDDGVTVIKVGRGLFVGAIPLAAPAFDGYPMRNDRSFDAVTGDVIQTVTLQPTVGALRLPKAVATTVSLERRIRPGLDGQIAVTVRDSSQLTAVRVPVVSGPLVVDSTGVGHYRELQFSARKTWAGDQQLFVSYVRSSANRELNDFWSVFKAADAALLQPGGVAPLSTDARNRVIAWGTFNLPSRVVVSPVVEWRTGFPYSELNDRYEYAGAPNSRTFPAFMAADMVVYKTVTIRRRTADVGVQIFNVTNHRNPRDVYPVVGYAQAGQFTNSVGPILRGYILLKW